MFKVRDNENLDDKFNLIKSKIYETNFTEAALIYSISDTANKGGKLGWINITAVSKKIKDKLKNIFQFENQYSKTNSSNNYTCDNSTI